MLKVLDGLRDRRIVARESKQIITHLIFCLENTHKTQKDVQQNRI